MIAVDTSTLVAYFSGEDARDTALFHVALLEGKVAVCPVVITEVLSGTVDRHIRSELAELRRLPFEEGFWERAADSRQKLFKNGFKAMLVDAVIAQSALDHDMPLLTRDHDFRHYASLCGLKMV